MKRQRVEIKMTFSADLDPIRGWGHHPDDWCTMLEQRIGATSDSPYNLKLVITDINCRDVPEKNETSNDYVSDNGQFGVGA